MKSAAGMLAAAAVLIQAARAQQVRIESYPSNHWFRTEIRLHVPSGKPVGLLVLVSGDINAFSKALLPQLLATNGVMTLIAAPARAGILASEPMLEELDSLIGDVLKEFNASDAKLAIGGFSAGGIAAIRYTQFCSNAGLQTGPRHQIPRAQEEGTHVPAAMFVVDSPLDYERWYHGAELYLQRLALAGRDLAEDRRATNELRTALGGSPAEAADAYRRYSPLTARLPDGGNARLLKNTPLRVYIEPEMKWRLENWNREVFHTNIPDATALVNILRLLGNTRAELITTSGAGYTADGSRNPHSWSIVDEPVLAQWLIQCLNIL